MPELYIGLDIGGTHMRGGLFREKSSRPIRTALINTPKTKKRFLDALQELIATLALHTHIAGIGISTRGTVDARRVIVKEDNVLVFLNEWHIKDSLRHWRVPAVAENDARCFTLAEARYGAGRGYKNIVGITIGTGIGSGIMIHGELDTGNHSGAGEIGKMIIDHGNTFEQLAAKTAFQKFGDRSKVIGIGVANIINTLDPDIVILGGRGGLHKRVRLRTVKKSANAYVKPALRGKTKIVKGILGEFAQALGATLLLQKARKHV